MITRATERWMAARALYESERPTLEQIAPLCGWSVATIKARAKREDWRRPEPVAAGKVEARVARVISGLLGEIEALGIGTGEGAVGLDKARIEAISALMRTLEKIGDITRENEEAKAKEKQTKRDADMAGFLKRIDERIVELATGYARELVRRKPSG